MHNKNQTPGRGTQQKMLPKKAHSLVQIDEGSLTDSVKYISYE